MNPRHYSLRERSLVACNRGYRKPWLQVTRLQATRLQATRLRIMNTLSAEYGL